MDFCGHSVPSPLLNAVLFAVITLSWQFPNPNTNHNLCPTFCLGRYQDLLLSKETIDFTLTFVSIYFFRSPHPPSISADGRMSERGKTSRRQRTEPWSQPTAHTRLHGHTHASPTNTDATHPSYMGKPRWVRGAADPRAAPQQKPFNTAWRMARSVSKRCLSPPLAAGHGVSSILSFAVTASG